MYLKTNGIIKYIYIKRKGIRRVSNKELIQYVKSCYELEKSIYLQSQVVDYYRKEQAYFQNYQKCIPAVLL